MLTLNFVYIVVFLTFLSLLSCCDLVQSCNVSEHDGNALYKTIFENYNPNVRPILNVSEPLIVNISLDLVKILEVDEINQTFKVTVNLLLSWIDEFLRWNASDYGGISKIVFPLDKNIWIPDLMNLNAAYSAGEFGQKYAFPAVYSFGFVAIWTKVNLETQCEILTKKYPLDTQHCSIAFTTFMSTDFEVRLRNTSDTTNMHLYRKVAEWTIANNFVSTEFMIIDIYRIIRYNFTLQRTCTSCVMNVIVPIIILALLGLLAFFVPTESGEKLTYPMSIFLTLAVFLTIITLSLPESVDGVSYISSFVTFELAISATTLLCTVITLRLHHEMGETSIPKVALWMVKYFRRNSDILQEKDCATRADMDNGLTNETIRGGREINGKSTADPRPCTTKQRNVFEGNKDMYIKWDHVSDAFDMMMFSIIFTTQIIAVTTFLTLILI